MLLNADGTFRQRVVERTLHVYPIGVMPESRLAVRLDSSGLDGRVATVAARSYEIRIRGHVPPEELEEVEDLHATVEPAETILRGCVPDQAALHGILTRLHSLGLELLEVRRVPVCDEVSQRESG